MGRREPIGHVDTNRVMECDGRISPNFRAAWVRDNGTIDEGANWLNAGSSASWSSRDEGIALPCGDARMLVSEGRVSQSNMISAVGVSS